MPENYSTPAWYTAEYKAEMSRLVRLIEETIHLELTPSEVMKYVAEHELDGPHNPDDKPYPSEVYWGPGASNIGYYALFTAPPKIYRHLFKSAARASIEVFVTGPSVAEDGLIPYQLCESLTLKVDGLIRLKEIDQEFRTHERVLLVDVLRLLRTRGDDVGEIADAALKDYWDSPK